MHLALDLGNTSHKCAIFKGNEIVHFESSPKLSKFDVDRILEEFQPQSSILSSVDTYNVELENYILSQTRGFVLNQKTQLPITNFYVTPETLGNDRLAGAVGAQSLYPDKDILVIDAGTCIKYDFINAQKEYLGGAISPGVGMRLRAMHDYTARIPLVDINMLTSASRIYITGSSTTDSILSGAGLGSVMEIQGIIDAYNKLYENLVVLLTGGDAPFFEMHIKRKIFVHPNLVLYGLNKILQYNLNLS
jgi:type III pantothenate kinase